MWIGAEGRDENWDKYNESELTIMTEDNSDHPLRLLIGAGGSYYNDFDLAKERELAWPEDGQK